MRAESNHREIILSRAEISEGARAQGKKRLQSCLAPPRELCPLAAPRASKKSFVRSCKHKLLLVVEKTQSTSCQRAPRPPLTPVRSTRKRSLPSLSTCGHGVITIPLSAKIDKSVFLEKGLRWPAPNIFC